MTEIRRVLEFLNDLDFDIDAREYEMCVDLPEASFAHRTRPLLQQLVKVHGPTLSPPGFELLLRKVTQRIFATLESILFFHDGGTVGGAVGSSSMAGLVMGMDDREFIHSGPSANIGSHNGSQGNGNDDDFGGTDCISQFGALKLANDVRLFMVRVEHSGLLIDLIVSSVHIFGGAQHHPLTGSDSFWLELLFDVPFRPTCIRSPPA